MVKKVVDMMRRTCVPIYMDKGSMYNNAKCPHATVESTQKMTAYGFGLLVLSVSSCDGGWDGCICVCDDGLDLVFRAISGNGMDPNDTIPANMRTTNTHGQAAAVVSAPQMVTATVWHATVPIAAPVGGSTA